MDGQQGTWTIVSGPSVPTFSDPNNNSTNVSGLQQGTYVFRWTVSGPCANGFDEVTVTGIPSTGNVLLKVFTVSGKEVFTAHGTPSQDALKLTLPASLSNGSYFMRVYEGENVLGSTRFSIMR